MAALPSRVTLVEVALRDGLEHESLSLPLEVKLGLVDRLGAAGVRVIDAGSFVSARWRPQFADTEALLGLLPRRPGVVYAALVPSPKAVALARAAGVEALLMEAATTESLSLQALNGSIREVGRRVAAAVTAAREAGMGVRVALEACLGCPYEGAVPPSRVARAAATLLGLGIERVTLVDTLGQATPRQVGDLLDAVTVEVPVERLAVHFHDGYGLGLVNIYAALQRGVSALETSLGGLGLCPHADVPANPPTEDVLHLLQGLGIETGIDAEALLEATRFLEQACGRPVGSRAYRARRGGLV